jgi:hypothetical protein
MTLYHKALVALFLMPTFAGARGGRGGQQQGPAIFLASIPKCGTHLIKKCLGLMNNANFGYPSRTFFDAAEQDFKRGGSILSHAPYNPKLGELIIQNNYKGIFMMRDPRDQAISFIHFAQGSMKIWDSIRSLPFDNALTQWISDTKLIKSKGRFCDPIMDDFGDIADFYKHYLPWADHPNFYTVRFENLIGAQGGGSDELQREEIKNIAAHLGIQLSDEQMSKIIQDLFGKSRTFRKGQIGSWREQFTPEQKELFKKVAGDLLIYLGYEKDYNW